MAISNPIKYGDLRCVCTRYSWGKTMARQKAKDWGAVVKVNGGKCLYDLELIDKKMEELRKEQNARHTSN